MADSERFLPFLFHLVIYNTKLVGDKILNEYLCDILKNNSSGILL